MTNQISYTIEELAKLLKVSKLTIYDLIKKQELSSYRVGRQMRVDASDLEDYKNRTKSLRGKAPDLSSSKELHNSPLPQLSIPSPSSIRPLIISGQEPTLDVLALHMEKNSKDYRPLRSYTGGLSSLLAMFRGETDIAATHLLDGDTGEYNIPYVKKILIGFPVIIVNLLFRQAGFYVKKGNPKNIQSWQDFSREDVVIVNREKGSGARILLDEQLRLNGISVKSVNGYEKEEGNHLVVAAMIANGEADVGIGTEKAAAMVDVDFIPMVTERYDLVMIKSPANEEMVDLVLSTLHSPSFKNEVRSIGGYDLSQTGKIVYET